MTSTTRSIAAEYLRGLICSQCGRSTAAEPVALCSECLAPLDVHYPDNRELPTTADIEARPLNLWRYREWLPLSGDPVAAVHVGWTPIVDAPVLAKRLNVSRCLLKVDAWSQPTLSFKDRVVATAINAALRFGLSTFGCASTGNLANAVAAAGAQAGLPTWVFVPARLEAAKLIATAIYGARLVRVDGSYDDVNRLCSLVADRYPWGFANVNLRAYYGEGSKTMAFEIVEQLGWELPDAVVAPMAGGSLVTKLEKGFREFTQAGLVRGTRPRVYGAQAEGCAPIVRLWERGDDLLVPEIPQTIAHSLAIGNPADGRRAVATLNATGGGAVAVSDAALRDGIRILAESAGVFGETAAGVTVAGAIALAERGAFRRADTVVICLTGNGLKTTDAVASVTADAPLIAPTVRAVASLLS